MRPRGDGGMTTDWVAWHDPYLDPDSPLSRRLRSVQRQIGVWLDETAPRDVMVLSLCAGDGRDLLGVLDARNDARRVRAAIVEIVPELADRARAAVDAARLVDIDVLCIDAGTPEAYAGCPPADLVLLCARVIWTRSRRSPDLTPQIRKWFSDNGFTEITFDAPEDLLTSVGVHELTRRPGPATRHTRLFAFVR